MASDEDNLVGPTTQQQQEQRALWQATPGHRLGTREDDARVQRSAGHVHPPKKKSTKQPTVKPKDGMTMNERWREKEQPQREAARKENRRQASTTLEPTRLAIDSDLEDMLRNIGTQ